MEKRWVFLGLILVFLLAGCVVQNTETASTLPEGSYAAVTSTTSAQVTCTTLSCSEDPLRCEMLEVEADRFVCYILKAKVTGNDSLCEEIRHADYQKVCYQMIRAQQHGPASCDSIPNMYRRHICYDWVTATPPA